MAEKLTPGLQEPRSVRGHVPFDFPKLGPTKPAAAGEPYGIEPEFGNAIDTLDMNMNRLVAVAE